MCNIFYSLFKYDNPEWDLRSHHQSFQTQTLSWTKAAAGKFYMPLKTWIFLGGALYSMVRMIWLERQ